LEAAEGFFSLNSGSILDSTEVFFSAGVFAMSRKRLFLAAFLAASAFLVLASAAIN
jgi:hypothetical protein